MLVREFNLLFICTSQKHAPVNLSQMLLQKQGSSEIKCLIEHALLSPLRADFVSWDEGSIQLRKRTAGSSLYTF